MLADFFEFKKYKTTLSREIIAGVTTFMTMAYIIVVNPKILEFAGIPFGPSMVATILTAFIATFLVGIYANRPFAMAPYMGENAFVAFTVVSVLGYSWQSALGAIFIAGVLFTILTLLRIRSWLSDAIPQSLKYSFSVGIGLFITFIGLHGSGIISLGVSDAPLKVGDIRDPSVILSIIGFLLIATLMVKKVKGAILLGMLTITGLAVLMGFNTLPSKLVGMPPSIAPIFFKMDVLGALRWSFFPIILTVFVMDFVDTMGTLIGVSARAGFLDKDGNLPEIEKPMLVDAFSTVVAAICGTTTAGTFIESAAGIEEGGRTGLTAVVTAILFLLALFFAPLFSSVPSVAYGPALIVVGILMLEPITRINFKDYTELIPSFCTIVLMSFTYNLGIGITAGFILYPFFKVISKRAKEVHPGGWILAILSLLFYIFYPYH
jgi:AGZA family xanthine/uracil permease-like MFS transporter